MPSHEDVALPSSNQITAVPDVLQSPLSHHRRGFMVNCKFIALTTDFLGKEAWRPTPKWNTKFFFAFSKRTQLWLP